MLQEIRGAVPYAFEVLGNGGVIEQPVGVPLDRTGKRAQLFGVMNETFSEICG